MLATGILQQVGKVNTDRTRLSAMRVRLGGSRMKLPTILSFMAALIASACLASGCGSKAAVNTVTIAVSSSVGMTAVGTATIIVGQSTTLTASVTGFPTTTFPLNWQPS